MKKSKGDQAKELLTKYGGAYLATSITLSLISFSLCYALITAGVDVQALLQKVIISSSLFAIYFAMISITHFIWIRERVEMIFPCSGILYLGFKSLGLDITSVLCFGINSIKILNQSIVYNTLN